MNIRTDLAMESTEAYKGLNKSDAPGVEMVTKESGKLKITRVHVSDENGASALGKPIGNYITIEMPQKIHQEQNMFERTCQAVANELASIVRVEEDDMVLVVGLGNRNITPDALGPKVLDRVLVTRHIVEELPDEIEGSVRPVCGITPGVLGITGIESSEVIRGIVDKVNPKMIIAIDALASRRVERVATTIQLSDTGINPGAGIGNKRNALNYDTMGVPVIGIGVPTVVDAATMASDTIELVIDKLAEQCTDGSAFYNMLGSLDRDEKYMLIQHVLSPTYMGNLIVTPKEVDEIINDISEIIANGINMAMHKGVTIKDLNKYA